MAYFFSGQSHTFNEYLLVPGYSSSECIPDNVSLRTPLTRFRAGEEPALSLNVPMVSAVMQSVSGDRLAVALAQEGGVSFLYGSQSIEDEAAMVARVKSYKAGFVRSDSNISPDATLADILAPAGADRPLHRRRHRGRHGRRPPGRHRHEPRLPREPHGARDAGARIHDAAREDDHRARRHVPEGSQQHHLGAQAQLTAHRQ